MPTPSSVKEPLIQQTLLGEAVDNGPAAIFVLGEDMRYVAVNETACKLLGYDRNELLALGPADLAPEADLEERFAELARTGKLVDQVQLRTKSGELVDFAYRTSETTAARMRFWISVGFPQ